MKIQMLFFGRLGDEMGQSKFDFEPDSNIYTVADLLTVLENEHGKEFVKPLKSNDVLMAVNHAICDSSQVVAPGDEVAFMPPVTGG